MSGETILIVEDNPINLKLVQVLLKREGYQVLSAMDAHEALGIIHDSHPDLILMDVELPDMDGLALVKILKSDPLTRQILIIVLTAYAMTEDKDKATAAGCDGYITKPFNTHDLIDTIAHLIQHAPRTVL